MTQGHNSTAIIRGYAERIFNMDQQIKDAIDDHVKPLREDKKDLFDQAEAEGFNKKALAEVVRKMKMDLSLRAEITIYEEAILEELLS